MKEIVSVSLFVIVELDDGTVHRGQFTNDLPGMLAWIDGLDAAVAVDPATIETWRAMAADQSRDVDTELRNFLDGQ